MECSVHFFRDHWSSSVKWLYSCPVRRRAGEKKVSKEGAKKARVANLISLSDTFKIRPREVIVTDPLQEEPLTKIEHELENG